ncbi:hypothetical protein [Stenotrophomonas sp. VV52]|uniref:hypothetical protein n=1 Tax=Stenotrophomonas sp. VV52 TaxID=2066958 RepID=UPI000C9E3358|nr:hypothetical protein [Stenotrophomonas sp. VV52]
MSRQQATRAPKRNDGFSWGRFPVGSTGTVTYRLFRRDHKGALHMSILNFYPARDRRADIAVALRHACHQLRDRVDEINLAAMGVAA